MSMSGVQMIEAERERQIASEGWTFEHDDEHDLGEMAGAGMAYAAHALYHREPWQSPNGFWPKEWAFKPDADPIRNYVKAGALIAAEIDRLVRVATGETK